jgi:hypothetical protein
MKTLRLPNHNVGVDDFRGGYAVCQNLFCLCPIEPPVHALTLESTEGHALHTVLCCRCASETKDATDTVFEVVEAGPVLELPG